MGKSSGTSSTQVQMSPQQERALNLQTNALEKTFLPAYENTVGSAKSIYDLVAPGVGTAAQTALDVTGRTGRQQELAGAGGLGFGMSGLASLFGPQYKEQQIQAAMQPAREDIREQVGSQNAMFGGAGGAGSTRYGLARENLKQLGEQRLATAAAQASSGVEANRAAAANQLATLGSGLLTSAQTTAAGRAGLASQPLDAFAKYAGVVFGTPQASTTPNFQGTQSGTTSGKSSGFRL